VWVLAFCADPTAMAANDIWAMDFVHNQLFDGKKSRILTIIDAESYVAERRCPVQLSRK
jgi:hypothetical protein